MNHAYQTKARDILAKRDEWSPLTLSHELEAFVATRLQAYADVLYLDNFCVREEPAGAPPAGAIQMAMDHVLKSLRNRLLADVLMLRGPAPAASAKRRREG